MILIKIIGTGCGFLFELQCGKASIEAQIKAAIMASQSKSRADVVMIGDREWDGEVEREDLKEWINRYSR
jgi:hypothetical protein